MNFFLSCFDFLFCQGGNGTYECGASGQWININPLVCNAPQCSPLDMTQFQPNVTASCTGLNVGDQCALSCGRPRQILGDNILTCGDDGVWIGGCGFRCGNWSQLDGNVYTLIRTPHLTYNDAEFECQTYNAHLASITTPDENVFVFNLQPVQTQVRWIGGYRDRADSNAAPFTWLWSDSTPFTIFDAYYPPSAGGYAGCLNNSGLNGCCTQDAD
jgi:hypothetical protein